MTNFADKRISMKSKKVPVKPKKVTSEVKVPSKGKKSKEGAKEKEIAVSTKPSSKTNFTINNKRYSSIKTYLNKRGDEYDIVFSGTTEKIRHNGKVFIPFDKEGLTGSGYHISNIVKADIKKWLNNPDNVLIKRERDYTEQIFNLDNIEKNINNVLVSIDINDCYWQTAYNLGFITQKTFDKGLTKKEWKVGRNASIGSLCKTETIVTFKDGVVARDSFGKLKKRVIRRDENHQHIRHNIIGFVYDMFIELADILGEDFYMVLTDCVFTTMRKKKIVEDFFKSKGYSSKSKVFEFINLNRNEKVVEWIELKKADTPKYYRYSAKQIYFNNK